MGKASQYAKVAHRKAIGQCIDCPNSAIDPTTGRKFVRCAACRKKWSDRRYEIIQQGICADCRRAPRLLGRRACAKCVFRSRRSNRATAARRKAKQLAAQEALKQARGSVAMLESRGRLRRVKITC